MCRKLLHRNPDNQRHHAALLEALQLDAGNAAQTRRVAALYDELARQFPHSMAVRRLPLDFKVLLLLRWLCLFCVSLLLLEEAKVTQKSYSRR